jgi:hypothetical protein
MKFTLYTSLLPHISWSPCPPCPLCPPQPPFTLCHPRPHQPLYSHCIPTYPSLAIPDHLVPPAYVSRSAFLPGFPPTLPCRPTRLIAHVGLSVHFTYPATSLPRSPCLPRLPAHLTSPNFLALPTPLPCSLASRVPPVPAATLNVLPSTLPPLLGRLSRLRPLPPSRPSCHAGKGSPSPGTTASHVLIWGGGGGKIGPRPIGAC